MKTLSFCIVSLFLFACSQPSSNSSTEETSENTNAVSSEEKYEVITTVNPDQTYGYQILKDGKLMIDQKNIPAIQGIQGFSSKKDAETTASFAIEKIKKGAFPPTISVDELDSLGVIEK